jgi:hypothetical protein
MCGKEMSEDSNERFIVKIEVFTAPPNTGQLSLEDLEVDHMESLNQQLRDDERLEESVPSPTAKKLRYDLCPDCQRKFVKNPLRSEPSNSSKFDFSEN